MAPSPRAEVADLKQIFPREEGIVMKKTTLALAILSATAASVQAGTITTDGPDIVVKTKGGFEAKTTDGSASFKLGGRIQLDYNNYDGVMNAVPGKDGSDLFFRRARLELEGHYQDWGYLMAYNLTEGGSIDLLHTTYMGWGPLALLTFGQQKEDFGLEDTGSSKRITTMERSMPANAFDTGNNLGVKLHGFNEDITYSLGAYKQNLDSNNDLNSAITGRFVVRPIHDGSNLVHLGVGYTTRDGDFTQLGARLGVRGGDAGNATRVRARYAAGVVADELKAWNAELAGSFGPVHAMAEYFDGKISGAMAAPDIKAQGYSVQLGWIITGETRTYKNEIGAFDKIKPAGVGGAYEVFARYDELDASDNKNVAPVQVIGETGNTITVGVNWYANELVKVALNYVHADTDQKIGGEDSGDAIVSRIQYAF